MQIRRTLLLAAALAAGCGPSPRPAPVAPAPAPAPSPAPAPPPPAGPSAEDLARAERERAEAAAKEQAAARDAERRAALALLKDTRPGDDPSLRAGALDEAARGAREFLAKWPDGDPEGEIAAGAAGAEGEAKRCRDYAAAFARSQMSLDAGDGKAALAAADEALRVFPREEARTLRLQALRASAPKGMVLVPEGPALLGRKKESTVVRAFFIDRTEVTCGRFAEFLAETRSPPPPGWSGIMPPQGKKAHPVVNVTGEEAAAFAKWDGKRLPTEVEWEKAARGADGRTFPWGDDFDPEKGWFGLGGTRAAGERPADLSPFGLLDAGGNVSEFTVPVLGFREPAGGWREEDRPRWVVKGGRWGSEKTPDNNALFQRYPFKAGEKDNATGFRCAKSVE